MHLLLKFFFKHHIRQQGLRVQRRNATDLLFLVDYLTSCWQVFLYNFFHDSAVEVSQWRLVLNSISTEDPTLESAPRFDSTRHAAICAEVFIFFSYMRCPLFIFSSAQIPLCRYHACTEQLANRRRINKG